MSQEVRRWYVIQCKPREDARALRNLENQSYEVYQPLLTREVVRAGLRQTTQEALFPGYLFIRLSDAADNWAPLRSTRGVARLVCFGMTPAVVPDEVVATVAAYLRDEIDAGTALFRPGQAVSIVSGPFAGLDAVFSAHDGNSRVIVLLKVLQQTQTLSLPLDQIMSGQR